MYLEKLIERFRRARAPWSGVVSTPVVRVVEASRKALPPAVALADWNGKLPLHAVAFVDRQDKHALVTIVDSGAEELIARLELGRDQLAGFTERFIGSEVAGGSRSMMSQPMNRVASIVWPIPPPPWPPKYPDPAVFVAWARAVADVRIVKTVVLTGEAGLGAQLDTLNTTPR